MPSAPHRLEPLDWLRGLMALSIMLYHLGGKDNAASLLGRLGIYGVSIFFILSGLSMAIAYGRYIDDLKSAGAFWIRRLFRIWPLLWLAVALVAIPAFFAGHPYSESMIALNLTTLFGFVAPEKYINQGAWSIGNEMVYYLLTPALIPIFRRSLVVGNLLTVLSTLLACMFAFRLLNPAVSLSEQWGIYINPMNNLFLYMERAAAGIGSAGIRFLSRQWRSDFACGRNQSHRDVDDLHLHRVRLFQVSNGIAALAQSLA
jgi:exopolysaccharide production protein ExoZ